MDDSSGTKTRFTNNALVVWFQVQSAWKPSKTLPHIKYLWLLWLSDAIIANLTLLVNFCFSDVKIGFSFALVVTYLEGSCAFFNVTIIFEDRCIRVHTQEDRKKLLKNSQFLSISSTIKFVLPEFHLLRNSVSWFIDHRKCFLEVAFISAS